MTTTSTTTPLLDAGMQTGHVGLNVSDLDRSVAFYTRVFGLSPVGDSREVGREFAFLGDGSRLVLTLWQQSAGEARFPTDRPGLHHLSFQVPTIEAVREAERRLREVGARVFHDGIVPHSEGGASGGVFFEDPDGIRLEVYAPSGAEGASAPTPGAPTCGFF